MKAAETSLAFLPILLALSVKTGASADSPGTGTFAAGPLGDTVGSPSAGPVEQETPGPAASIFAGPVLGPSAEGSSSRYTSSAASPQYADLVTSLTTGVINVNEGSPAASPYNDYEAFGSAAPIPDYGL